MTRWLILQAFFLGLGLLVSDLAAVFSPIPAEPCASCAGVTADSPPASRMTSPAPGIHLPHALGSPDHDREPLRPELLPDTITNSRSQARPPGGIRGQPAPDENQPRPGRSGGHGGWLGRPPPPGGGQKPGLGFRNRL